MNNIVISWNFVYLMLKSWRPKYLYQDQTEIDFRLSNGTVVELKIHDEPLFAKQAKMFLGFDENHRHIVRSYQSVQELLFNS